MTVIHAIVVFSSTRPTVSQSNSTYFTSRATQRRIVASTMWAALEGFTKQFHCEHL